MKTRKKFNVLICNVNTNEVEAYDILPYFRDEYRKCKKANRPSTRMMWEAFVRSNGMHMFWSRCEWEIIITDWPNQVNHTKIDVWQQIENNLDIIIDILMEEYGKKINSKRSMD